VIRPSLLLRVILAPFAVLAQVITTLAQMTAAEARHKPASPPPFDYQAWQLEAAKRKQARNQEAFRRRQANKPKGFAGSVAELRQIQGEQP
jgi:invasion protein IalB